MPRHATCLVPPVSFVVAEQYHEGRQFVEYVLSINLLVDAAVTAGDPKKAQNRAGKWILNRDAQKARRMLGFDVAMQQRREGMQYLQVGAEIAP